MNPNRLTNLEKSNSIFPCVPDRVTVEPEMMGPRIAATPRTIPIVPKMAAAWEVREEMSVEEANQVEANPPACIPCQCTPEYDERAVGGRDARIVR